MQIQIQIQIQAQIKKLKEEPKDERTKIGKIMDGLLSKDDFLMDLGLRLLEGEGVFPGAIKAAKTQKAADAKEAKAELDAALADSLIKDRLAPADVLQIAQVEAANKIQILQVKNIKTRLEILLLDKHLNLKRRISY